MDLENDNEKVNQPLLPSPEPSVSCMDDLDFVKDFENEFPVIVYNDALTSKSDYSTKPTLCPQHNDKFDLKDETSLSEYDEVEQNVLYFNDLFPFNIVYPDDLKSDKGNDDNKIDMIQSSGGIKCEYHGWNHFVNGMLFNLIKNLYVSFGIPFDPKRYYKDGDCARMLRRPRYGYIKNHKKTIKNGQAQTRERRSVQKPKAKPRKSQPSLKQMAPNPNTIHPSSSFHQAVKTKGFLQLRGTEVYSRAPKHNGKVNSVKSRAIISHSNNEAHVSLKKAHMDVGFALISLRKETQVSLKWIASLAIRVRSLSDLTAQNVDPMIG
ncbi:hypothetical protein Tco_0791306 [Tanacetum coccineum]